MKNFLSNISIKDILRGVLSLLFGMFVGRILILLLNCLPVAPTNHIDPQAEAYVKTFMEYANKYGALNSTNWNKVNDLRVNVRKLPWYLNINGSTIGLCDTTSIHIALDSKYWKEANHLEKEMLVFYELSHCLLDQGHVEGEDHIMNPYILSGVTYSIYYQKLMDKLFVCSKNCPVVKFERGRYL